MLYNIQHKTWGRSELWNRMWAKSYTLYIQYFFWHTISPFMTICIFLWHIITCEWYFMVFYIMNLLWQLMADYTLTFFILFFLELQWCRIVMVNDTKAFKWHTMSWNTGTSGLDNTIYTQKITYYNFLKIYTTKKFLFTLKLFYKL